MRSADSNRILVWGGGGLGGSLAAGNVQQMDTQSVFKAVLNSFNNSAEDRQIITSAVTLQFALRAK